MSILHDRLLLWTDSYVILPTTQFGFRKNCSTILATKSLISDIQKSIGIYRSHYVCFVDFEKAFDKIDRNLLLIKLQQLGLDSHLLNVLQSIYSKNTITVVADGVLNSSVEQVVGVPQGDKLSPLLFALFIADLSKELERTGCFIVFYADDLAIGSFNLQRLQSSMVLLADYCTRNLLSVNTAQTKVMKFRKGGKLTCYDKLTYSGTDLDFVSSFEYLGIVSIKPIP